MRQQIEEQLGEAQRIKQAMETHAGELEASLRHKQQASQKSQDQLEKLQARHQAEDLRAVVLEASPVCDQEQACDLKATAKDTNAYPKVKVTAAAAAGGAVSLGAGGGVVGLAGGGAIGAACGVIPAIFTFGLSIPIGAAIGASTG